jgi:membrane glycosyltransferase
MLLRGLQAKLLGRFSLFYGYLAFVLLSNSAEYFTWNTPLYKPVYWTCEFASALIGCAIIFELYRQSLRPYPLLANMANKVMLFVVALVVARILAGITWTASQDWQATARLLERDLRITQAIFLCGLLLLVVYYSVSMGRNLKGLTIGYGLFLGLNIAELTLRNVIGQPFHQTLMFLQPASYDAVLCIWLASLWVKDPVTQRSPSTKLDEDYAQLVAATRKRLAQTEEQLIRIIRP